MSSLIRHIACHLGEGICKFPKAEFVILSNDKGFDPLVRHLVARGFKCRRDSQASSASAARPQHAAHAQPVAAPNPHNYLATHFQKKLAGEEIKQAVEHLLEVGLIAGTEAAVTYNIWVIDFDS